MFSPIVEIAQTIRMMSGKGMKGGRKGGKGGRGGACRAIGPLMVILALIVALSAPMAARSQGLVESGTSLVAMSQGILDPLDAEDWAAGFKVGGALRVDEDRGLWIRTVYSRFNWGPGNIQSLEVTPAMSFYVGKRWQFYALGGLAAYLSGENTGLSGMGGLGFQRRFWTEGDPTVIGYIPASCDAFGELLVTDDDTGTGSYLQLNLGLKFNFGKKG